MAVDLDGTLGNRAVVRTCVGCRRRAPASELLRVVAAPGCEPVRLVIVDPRRRAPGRGAWVHPDTDCVALAQRRRAFGRALRVSVPMDPSALVAYVAQRPGARSTNVPPGTDRPVRSGSLRKREEA